MNSSDHPSAFIGSKTMDNMVNGALFAWQEDMPLNRFLSFNLGQSDKRAQEFVSKFTKLAGDWLRSLEVRRAYIWVLEHPPGKSLNLHLLVHVPEHLTNA